MHIEKLLTFPRGVKFPHKMQAYEWWELPSFRYRINNSSIAGPAVLLRSLDETHPEGIFLRGKIATTGINPRSVVNFSEYGDRCHADIEAQLREDYGLIDADLEPAPFLGAAEPIVQHGAPLASKPHMLMHHPCKA